MKMKTKKQIAEEARKLAGAIGGEPGSLLQNTLRHLALLIEDLANADQVEVSKPARRRR